jgi:hypothetical protein
MTSHLLRRAKDLTACAARHLSLERGDPKNLQIIAEHAFAELPLKYIPFFQAPSITLEAI